MNIGIVYFSGYPWNRGIHRAAQILITYGHRVYILCRNSKHRKQREEYEEETILRFPHPRFKKLGWFFSLPIPFNILWTLWLLKRISEEQIECLIVREILLVFPAFIASKIRRIPILLDMRENYPAAVAIWGKREWLHHITRCVPLIRLLEKQSLKLVNHVFVVVKEQKERLLNMGISPNRISIVENVPSHDFLVLADKVLNQSTSQSPNDIIKFIYPGYLMAFRGIREVIEAMPIILQERQDVELVLYGEGPQREEIAQLIQTLNLQSYVKLYNFVPPEEVPSIIGQSDIGISNNWVCEHTNTTAPGKIFEYMALGKPFVCSATRPQCRIVREEQCGVVIPRNEPESIAQTLLSLINSPELRVELGQNGRRAILEHYNPWREGINYIKALHRVAKS